MYIETSLPNSFVLINVFSYGPIVRIVYSGSGCVLADQNICAAAAYLIEKNPSYKYYPLDIHDGSWGSREGILTFYEKD